MYFELHAALARQAEQQVRSRTRDTRPGANTRRERRTRARIRPERFDG